MNQDSAVRTVTRYRPDSPGNESQRRRRRRDFPHHSGLALEPNQPPVWGVLGLSPGGTAAEAWCWPHTISSTEVKERVELYLYSLSLPWWSVLRPILPFFNFTVQLCNSIYACVLIHCPLATHPTWLVTNTYHIPSNWYMLQADCIQFQDTSSSKWLWYDH